VRRNFLKAGIIVGLFFPFMGGCAPGPPPPLLGGPGAFGIGWIILGLIAVGVAVLWKKSNDKRPPKTDYITNALNDINDRLKNLEEKIKRLER